MRAAPATVVAAPSTRAIASHMVTAVRCGEGTGDATLMWLPEVHPQQYAALVTSLLAVIRDAGPIRPPATETDERLVCRDCSTRFDKLLARGLCSRCYSRHHKAGTLHRFPAATGRPVEVVQA